MQIEMFERDADAMMLRMWRDGRHADEIAAHLFLTETRVIYDINRLLNAEAAKR